MKITEILAGAAPVPQEETQSGFSYETGVVYNGIIAQIKYLPIGVIERKAMDFRPEVLHVSDRVAARMDYREPVEVTAFRYGKNNDDTSPSVQLQDGHHRVAAALQTGRPYLPVHCMARNAKGEKLNALIQLSMQIEASLV